MTLKSKTTIKVRCGVFETNSSSTHSLTIEGVPTQDDTLTPDSDGTITLTGGQFGWAWERFNDARTKANYCAAYAQGRLGYDTGKPTKSHDEYANLLNAVLCAHTGAKLVVWALSDKYDAPNYSYIDHQALEDCNTADAFASAEALTQFIFSPMSWLFTGNDNETAPPNLMDVNREFKYTHKLSMEGTEDTVLFDSVPDKKRLKDEIYNLYSRHPVDKDMTSDFMFEFDHEKSCHLKEGYIEVKSYKYYDAKDGKRRKRLEATKRLKFELEALARKTVFDRLLED